MLTTVCLAQVGKGGIRAELAVYYGHLRVLGSDGSPDDLLAEVAGTFGQPVRSFFGEVLNVSDYGQVFLNGRRFHLRNLPGW